MVKIPKKSEYEKRVHPLVGHEPTQGYIAHADQKHDRIHHQMDELEQEETVGTNARTLEQIVYPKDGSKPIVGTVHSVDQTKQ